MKWKDLKPFPFKKKLGTVSYNGFGKFFCNVIEDNKELPQLFVYDVRSCFPSFDKYWENERNQREGLQKIKGRDIKVHQMGMYSLSSKQERQYGIGRHTSDNDWVKIDKDNTDYTGEPTQSSGNKNLALQGRAIELDTINQS